MGRIVKKAAERRHEIIKAARALFQSQEFGKMTMQDVIDSVGIAKGTLYHHFTSKSELLEAVVEDIVDEELERKCRLMEEQSHLGALEKMKLLATEGDLDKRNEKLLENLHHPDNYEIHTKQMARLLVKVAPLYGAVIAQGCEEGVFETEFPLQSAEFILAAVQFLNDVGVYPWTKEQLQQRAKSLPALLEAQLKAPKGAFSFLN